MSGQIQSIVDERGEEYGHPFVNHTRTARLWNAYLANRDGGKPLDPLDVCMFNILQKISRSQEGHPSVDTLQDIAGYAVNAQIVCDTESSRPTRD